MELFFILKAKSHIRGIGRMTSFMGKETFTMIILKLSKEVSTIPTSKRWKAINGTVMKDNVKFRRNMEKGN